MRHIPLLFACAAGLAAQSYRIRTVAGPGVSPDDVAATSVQFRSISSLAAGPDGRVYIADRGDHRIREIGTDGIIRTIAGTGVAGKFSGRIDSPFSLVADRCGSLYFLQREPIGFGTTRTIWRVDTGRRTLSPWATTSKSLVAIAIRGDCDLLALSDENIVYLVRNEIFERVAGGGASTAENVPALDAAFAAARAFTADRSGGVFVVEEDRRIRRVDPVSGNVTTFAGAINSTVLAQEGESALGRFISVLSLAVAADGSVYFSSGGVFRLAAGSAVLSRVAGGGSMSLVDGIAPRDADVRAEFVAVNAAGEPLFSEPRDNRIARVAGNKISLLAGRPAEGLPATDAILEPSRVALGSDAFFVVGGSLLYRIRSDNVVRTVTQSLQEWDFLAADSAGNAYYPSGSPSTVVQVRPDNRITPLPALNRAAAAAPGWDGSVYFHTRTGGSRLQRYQPETQTLSVVQDLQNPATLNRVDARLSVALAVDGQGAAYLDATLAGAPIVARILEGQGLPWRTPVTRAIAADAAGNTYYADADIIRRMTPDRFEYAIAALSSFSISSDRAGRLLVSHDRRVSLLEPGPPPRFLFPFGGGGQTRPPGAKAWLTALLLDRDGLPYGGGPIDFSVTAGAATLSSQRVRTNADGSATVEVTLGTAVGPVTVQARAGDLPPVEFRLNVAGQLPAGTPVINTGGIAGAGLASPPLRAFAAGGILSVFAANAAPAGTNRRVGADDLIDGQAPENFAGTCILVGGQRAPVFAVTETQVNFQAPDILPGRYPVRLIRNCGMPGELVSDPQFVDIAAAAPEFFYFPARPGECRPIAAVDAATGALIGAPGSIPGVETRPARPGQVLSLFLQGLGQTEPAVAAGAVSPLAAEVRNPIVVEIDGREADVLYAGRTPNNPGLYQLNVRVPRVETNVLRVVVEVRGSSGGGCLAYQP